MPPSPPFARPVTTTSSPLLPPASLIRASQIESIGSSLFPTRLTTFFVRAVSSRSSRAGFYCPRLPRQSDPRARIFAPANLNFIASARPQSIMSRHPQTPQSPSQFSPTTGDSVMSMPGSVASTTATLPTPAHSVNGSSIPSEMTQDTSIGGDSPHKRKREADDMGGRAQKKVHVESGNLGIGDLHLDVGEKYLLCRTRKAPFYLCDPISFAFPCTAIEAGLSTSLIRWRLWRSAALCR